MKAKDCKHLQAISDLIYTIGQEAGSDLTEFTVGFSPDMESFGWQTGDNSFSGGAYPYPIWAVTWIDSDSDPMSEALDLIDDALEQIAMLEEIEDEES